MKYAQLYITDRRGQVEKLGSDGVVPMDGRLSMRTMRCVANHHAKLRGCTAFQLRSGRSYSNSLPISDIIQVEQDK